MHEKLRTERVYLSTSGVFLLWIFGILFFSLTVQAGTKKSPDAGDVMESLQKRYNATRDFVAEFFQETEIKAMNRSLKASGTLYFKRPAMMLWEYEDPQGQFFLADGNSFYLYQPEQRQVVKSPLKEAVRSDLPLSFLWGMGNIKRDFQGKLKAIKEDHYVLELQPKKAAQTSVGTLVLGVGRENFDVIWVRIEDPVENVTLIRFSKIRRGVGLDDSLFRFKPPNGADIVEFPAIHSEVP